MMIASSNTSPKSKATHSDLAVYELRPAKACVLSLDVISQEKTTWMRLFKSIAAHSFFLVAAAKFGNTALIVPSLVVDDVVMEGEISSQPMCLRVFSISFLFHNKQTTTDMVFSMS